MTTGYGPLPTLPGDGNAATVPGSTRFWQGFVVGAAIVAFIAEILFGAGVLRV